MHVSSEMQSNTVQKYYPMEVHLECWYGLDAKVSLLLLVAAVSVFKYAKIYYLPTKSNVDIHI